MSVKSEVKIRGAMPANGENGKPSASLDGAKGENIRMAGDKNVARSAREQMSTMESEGYPSNVPEYP